jgi:methylated-DNA-[protein]-cysteine S-methyltransferase
MPYIITSTYQSSFGELIIGSYNNHLCLCDWRYRKMRHTIDQRIQKGLGAEYKIGSSAIIEETTRQLSAYFSAERTQFDIPLELTGTDFQQQVWKQLMQIPYGSTSSYLELSRQLGNPKAIRAVASANGANAISIIVPCHRVIGSDGKLIGDAGGLHTKKKLLELESSEKRPEQLKLFE